MADDTNELRGWDSLEPEVQTCIQVEYGYYLNTLLPTCSLESKLERFPDWLKTENGILYK